MKYLKPVLLIILACFNLNLVYAQTDEAKIAGKVFDAQKTPAEAATIILVNAKDSVVLKTVLAGKDGGFLFDKLKNGDYRVWVTTVGFKKYKSEGISINEQHLSINLSVIVLQTEGKQLKEVAITASKPFVEEKIDRTVVNVDALISNTGSNALEVLEKSPGVQVDENGNITYKGKGGVLVLIDDKPTYLSAADLATYLKSVPSATLDKIELMDNPPAKYDAAGSAGVINIKTKKNKAMGFNGSVSASFGEAIYSRNTESINLNYHVNKINIFANAAYSEQHGYRELDINRNYFDSNGNLTSAFKDASFIKPYGHSTNLKLGMDYYLSPKTTWGVVFTGTISPSSNYNPVYSSLNNSTGKLDSTINSTNTSKSTFNKGGINLNYSHKFDTTGTALTFDFDYVRYNSGSDQIFLNNTYLPNGSLIASQTISDNLPATINIYAAKTDYTHPLKGKARFDAGLKTSFVNTDNAANYFNLINNVNMVDNNFTNRFIYKENINAGYINFNKEFNRFAIQAGLRVENTNGTGHQLGNAVKPDSSFTNHYTNIFPTAYFSYKLDSVGHNTLVASYGRRIRRPFYQDLNPFITLNDKFTYFSGNPFLKPQFDDIYKLGYSYKSLLTASIIYSYSTNYQSETIEQSGNVFISRTGNIGETTGLGISVNAILPFTKWWSCNIYTEVFNNGFKGPLYATALNMSGTYWSISPVNQFIFTNGWSAELSGQYTTRRVSGQFTIDPRRQINGGIRKKILQNKGVVSLNVRDIFHTFRASGTIGDIPNATATYYNYSDTQQAILGFTYSFGKSANNRKRDAGSVDEQNRVKN
jgi:hypothetical protein